MNKIRINELARELEVKAHEILDKLPELGVTEKKTHSSSIDEDVALKLRRLFGGEIPEEHAEPEGRGAAPPERPAPAVVTSPAPEVTPASPLGQASAPPDIEEKAAEPAAAKAPLDRPAGRPAHPIRPPLAGSAPPVAQAPAPPRRTRCARRARRSASCACASASAWPSCAAGGQAGPAATARPGIVRPAATDAAGRQPTLVSIGSDFHPARCGRPRPQRAAAHGKCRFISSARRADSLRAQAACTSARRAARRASRGAAACGSGSQARPTPVPPRPACPRLLRRAVQ
jgi:translation initiation factor IF-2